LEYGATSEVTKTMLKVVGGAVASARPEPSVGEAAAAAAGAGVGAGAGEDEDEDGAAASGGVGEGGAAKAAGAAALRVVRGAGAAAPLLAADDARAAVGRRAWERGDWGGGFLFFLGEAGGGAFGGVNQGGVWAPCRPALHQTTPSA
jgi:hypothetical protein